MAMAVSAHEAEKVSNKIATSGKHRRLQPVPN